jgi:flagellar hook-associated protein 2
MTGIQLGGLASGLDTESLISQLMAVERQPEVRMQQQQTLISARQGVLRQVQTKLQTLRDTVADLSSPVLFANTQSTLSSDPTKLSLSLSGGAAPGSYEVSVTQLATAEQRTYAAPDTTNGTTITIDGHAIAIAAGASLDDVVATINGDSAAKAYAVNVGGQLVLAARATGQTGFTENGTAAVGGLTEIGTARAGKNLQWQIDGVAQADSESNTVSNAIAGVTLTMTATGTSTATIGAPAPDQNAIVSKVKAFVDAYNDATSFVQQYTNEQRVAQPQNDSDREKGMLNGDPMLTDLLSNMRIAISDIVQGAPAGLASFADIGVSTGETTGGGTVSQDAISGKLTFDASKLTAALTTNPNGVRSLLGALSGGSGLGQRLAGVLDPIVGSGNVLDEEISGADADLRDLRDQIADMEQRMTQRETTLRAQFTAMETALQQSQAQQQDLAARLGTG